MTAVFDPRARIACPFTSDDRACQVNGPPVTQG